MATVYRYYAFIPALGNERHALAEQWGTLDAIQKVGGVPLLSTGREIDVSRLDGAGMIRQREL
jgi:hypothetical protein